MVTCAASGFGLAAYRPSLPCSSCVAFGKLLSLSVP